MAICELPPESLLESVGAKILKARRKRARKIALPKKTAANMGTSGKGGQSGKEGQDMEPSEQEKDQSKHSGEDGTYVNAIPREKRNQVMAVDPRALLQRTGKCLCGAAMHDNRR